MKKIMEGYDFSELLISNVYNENIEEYNENSLYVVVVLCYNVGDKFFTESVEVYAESYEAAESEATDYIENYVDQIWYKLEETLVVQGQYY